MNIYENCKEMPDDLKFVFHLSMGTLTFWLIFFALSPLTTDIQSKSILVGFSFAILGLYTPTIIHKLYKWE